MKYNLNYYVKVRLTDKGRDIYYHQYDWINKQSGKEAIKPEYPKEDAEGYFKTQLWCLMQTFGQHIYMGCDHPFETEIILDETQCQ